MMENDYVYNVAPRGLFLQLLDEALGGKKKLLILMAITREREYKYIYITRLRVVMRLFIFRSA